MSHHYVFVFLLLLAGCVHTEKEVTLNSNAIDENRNTSHQTKPYFTVTPIYPQKAFDNNIEGWVKLEAVVTNHGQTKNVKILDSSPKFLFDENAVKAVRQWKWLPKQVNGKPVESKRTQIIMFKLDL